MRKIYSIHVPKTAGSTFYEILCQQYEHISPPYRRRDIEHFKLSNNFDRVKPVWNQFEVIHGHFYFREIEPFIEELDFLVTWIRHPVDRVVSNYRFFMEGFDDPSRNIRLYGLNKHRRDEKLLEYAELPENRNRMSDFLEGITSANAFVGILEQFDLDLKRLADRLNWSLPFSIPFKNRSSKSLMITRSEYETIKMWNTKDVDLYERLSRNNLA